MSQELKARLLNQASAVGQNLSDYLRDHLQDVMKSEGINVSFGAGEKSPILFEPHRKPSGFAEDIMDTYKEAMKIKTMMSVLGVDIGLGKQQNLPYGYPPTSYPYPQPQKEKKDIMTVVAELKALESLDKQTSDPEVKLMLKELKDAQVKQLQNSETHQPSGRDRMRELIEMMTFYKMAGQPEEAGKVQELIRAEMTKMTEKLHSTELAMQKQQADFTSSNLQRQIDDIRTAPTEFDQITKMSQLSEKDPAIRAFMHKRLGIEDKGEALTPEKLKNYLESVQVPVGKIVKMIYGFWQQHQGKPAEPPPQPTTAPPSEIVRTLPEKRLPPEPSYTTPTQREEPPAPVEIPLSPSPPGKTFDERKETARQMLIEGTETSLVAKATQLSGQQVRGMKGALVKQGKIKTEIPVEKPVEKKVSEKE